MITFAGERALSWQSRLKKCIALSIAGAEYIAITERAKELLFSMKEFIRDLGLLNYLVLKGVVFIGMFLGRNPNLFVDIGTVWWFDDLFLYLVFLGLEFEANVFVLLMQGRFFSLFLYMGRAKVYPPTTSVM